MSPAAAGARGSGLTPAWTKFLVFNAEFIIFTTKSINFSIKAPGWVVGLPDRRHVKPTIRLLLLIAQNISQNVPSIKYWRAEFSMSPAGAGENSSKRRKNSTPQHKTSIKTHLRLLDTTI